MSVLNRKWARAQGTRQRALTLCPLSHKVNLIIRLESRVRPLRMMSEDMSVAHGRSILHFSFASKNAGGAYQAQTGIHGETVATFLFL